MADLAGLVVYSVAVVLQSRAMRSHLFALKEAEMKRDLESLLRQWRDEGETIRAIAAKLSKKGTPVKRATVNLWCAKLGIQEEMREKKCHEATTKTH